MRNRKYFGTDGIRGKVGQNPITPDFFLKLGWAAGRILAQRGSRKIILGKDTRISGYMLEAALKAGLAAAGLSVAFTGPLPTPAIAYLTRIYCAEAGIVITASHNPYYENGIKFFSMYGTKLLDDLEEKIEEEMDKPLICVSSEDLLGQTSSRIIDADRTYIDYCKETFPNNLSLNGLKIILDCANGATYHIAPNVLIELGAEVITIGCEPNGLNINHGCGAIDVTMLQKKVVIENADIGLAFDGDGDRLIIVDQNGNRIDGDQIIYIIVVDALKQGYLNGGVVGTLMSNSGLELALQQLNIPFIRANVGDRYIIEKLKEKGWRFGAETSGHVILLDKTTTGDGIIAGLQILSAMIRNNMSIRDLCSELNLMPQVLVNVYFSGSSDPLSTDETIYVIKQVEKELSGNGRVLLRKSGTEPLIRVMVEGENKQQITAMANRIANAIKLTIR